MKLEQAFEVQAPIEQVWKALIDLERVGDLRGDVGFRDLLVGQRVRRFEAGHLCDPTDVDTQEELARL